MRIPSWKTVVKTPDDLKFVRLNGNSNACYKLSIKDKTVIPEDQKSSTPKNLLYRRFEQTVVDKLVEQAIFKARSDDKIGPHLYF